MLAKATKLMRKFQRRRRMIDVKKFVDAYEYEPIEALKILRANCTTMKDDTITFCIKLELDPTKGDQVVRGSCSLPSGTGKEIKVAFLCSNEENIDIAKSAGADLIVDKDTLIDISNDIINFDKIYSTPAGLQSLKPYARILGPRGLFPNAKVKTLVQPEEIRQVLSEAKLGKIDYRIDSGANIQGVLGKISFSDEKILMNLESVMHSILENKPKILKKNDKYLSSAQIKTSFGRPWGVYMPHIDPQSPENIYDKLRQNQSEN